MPTGEGIRIGRVYDEHDRPGAGHRVLVDRLWPRGMAKADAWWDEWPKEVAPSTELRRWYGHDVGRFDEFERRYRAEMRQPPANDTIDRLAAIAVEDGLTLLTATRDVDHSGARVLRDELSARVDEIG